MLDSVDLQEGMLEAGASSGLMAALFTAGIALPHMVAAAGRGEPGADALVDRFVRPTLAGETIGSLAITEPGGGSDVAGMRTTAGLSRWATATTTSSTAPRPSSPPASAPTS